MIMTDIKRRLGRFLRDGSGSVTVEFAIWMPILFWAFMACFVFFDGYRQSAINLKAANTIGDLISRETEAINDEYIDSMVEVVQLMTRANSDVDVRISVIRWDEGDNRYYLDWSANRGYANELTDANVSEIEDRLPIMPDNERVILVETNNVFVPLFKVGLGNIDLENFIFTRPRFVSQVLWEEQDDGQMTNQQDD